MPYHLTNRNRPIPNGITWRDSGTGYQAPAFSSFTAQAQGILQARLGNPAMTKRYHLSTDIGAIEMELDSGLAQIAFDNGWTDFYVGGAAARSQGGAPAPSPFPPRPRSLKNELAKVAEGGSILIQWLKEGNQAVPKELAESRAAVCVTCPKNDKGDWMSFFTVPVAGAFRRALESKNAMNLATSHDADLHVCQACSCVLKLKVWTPFDLFFPKMDAESKLDLWEKCWINEEAKQHGL